MSENHKFTTRAGRCFIMAEVTQSHHGSLGTAHACIDAVAKSGADAVKFQTDIVEAESTPNDPWRVKFSQQVDTPFDYWKNGVYTPARGWLKQHTEQVGLVGHCPSLLGLLLPKPGN